MNMSHKDGGVVHVEIYGKVLFDENGNSAGFCGTARDIIKRKKTEREIQERVLQLEKFNKVTIGRELRVVDLKNKVKELEKKVKKNKKSRKLFTETKKQG